MSKIYIEDEIKNIINVKENISKKAESDIFTTRTFYTLNQTEVYQLLSLLDNYKEILSSFKKQTKSFEFKYEVKKDG